MRAHARTAGRTCSRSTPPIDATGAAPDRAARRRARSRRSRSAGCSSAGRAGEADPVTAGRRAGGAAPRRRARRDRARRASSVRSAATCSSSSRSTAEGRSWYGEPGAGELVDWSAVLDRAGVPSRRCGSRRPTSSWPCSSARSRACGGGAHRLGAGPLVALGRPVRPAREPARPRRSKTCARSPPSRVARSPSSARSTSTSSRGPSGCRGPGRR